MSAVPSPRDGLRPQRAAGYSALSWADAAWHAAMADRMRLIAGDHTHLELASMLGHDTETVIEYLRTGRVDVHFLADFCRCFGLSPQWVLTGEGPRRPRRPRGRASPPP